MLKVVAGKYRSRLLEVPSFATIPTKNRVREAMLSMVNAFIPNSRVLDCFAGSGALGIETLSRGASFCLFIDSSKEAYEIIQKNLNSLRETNAEVLHEDFKCALSKQTLPFDIVFLDPPYADKGFYNEALRILKEKNLLSPSAILLLEYEGELPPLEEGYVVQKEKSYGYTKLLRLRREAQ